MKLQVTSPFPSLDSPTTNNNKRRTRPHHLSSSPYLPHSCQHQKEPRSRRDPERRPIASISSPMVDFFCKRHISRLGLRRCNTACIFPTFYLANRRTTILVCSSCHEPRHSSPKSPWRQIRCLIHNSICIQNLRGRLRTR